MFCLPGRLTGGVGGGATESRTGERAQACLNPLQRQMDERGGDYRGAPHDTRSFKATPEQSTLPLAYPAGCIRTAMDLLLTGLQRNSNQVNVDDDEMN